MSKRNILLIGGGGHCKSCIEVIESTNEYEIVGIIDIKENVGKRISGYEVIGTDEDLGFLRSKYSNAIITLGQLKTNDIRKRIYGKLNELEYNLPTIIASTAYVSKRSKIGHGVSIGHFAAINANSYIGDNTIINSRSLIEHDSIVGKHSHISTGAILNGNVHIADNVFIGSNSTIGQGVNIRSNCIIGAASLVLKDINIPGVYAGSPVKRIK